MSLRDTPPESKPRVLWPSGPWPVVVPALAIFLIVLSAASARWQLPYQDWSAISTEFMSQLFVVGPIAAAAAAYQSSRVLTPGRIFALRPGQRPVALVIARNLAPLVGSLLAAYTLALMPLVVLGLRDATDGRLLAGPVVTGLVGLVAFIVAGFTIGALIPSIAAVPLAFLTVFGVGALGNRGDMQLSPVPSVEFSIGSLPATPLVMVRLIVLSLVVLGCGAYLLKLALGSRRMPWSTVLSLSGIVALALVAYIRPPDIVRLEAQPPQVCSDRGSVTFCVHRGHIEQLPALMAAAQPVLEAYDRSTSRHRVYDSALGGRYAGDAALNDGSVKWIVMGPDYDIEEVVRPDLASQLVSSAACQDKFEGDTPAEILDIYTYLAQWLSDDDGQVSEIESDYPYFRSLTPDEMRVWLRDHRADLDSCTVDPGSLPR